MWYMCEMEYHTGENDHLLTNKAQQKAQQEKEKRWKTGRLEQSLHQMINTHKKMVKFIGYQGSSHRSHVLLLQHRHAANSDTVKTLKSGSPEHLCCAGGSVNSCNHFGQQFGVTQWSSIPTSAMPLSGIETLLYVCWTTFIPASEWYRTGNNPCVWGWELDKLWCTVTKMYRQQL